MKQPKRAFVHPPPRPSDQHMDHSWWADLKIQQSREAFDQAVAKRSEQSWGEYGSKAGIVRILE